MEKKFINFAMEIGYIPNKLLYLLPDTILPNRSLDQILLKKTQDQITEYLHHNPTFRISSGLKRIIGRDLILNDFVAIFELVKNSFDAQATRVDIHFLKDSILIIDDGIGMSYDDLINKWLFVAYSEKKDIPSSQLSQDFRSKIQEKRVYAGSKGIGRFSCDRLGKSLKIQTCTQIEENINILTIDWDAFEFNDENEFDQINVHYDTLPEFDLYKGITAPKRHGTILEIVQPREEWNRDKLIKLKRSLAKLVNPFGDSSNQFEVYIHALAEKEKDSEINSQSKRDLNIENLFLVNGIVTNFIFKTLEKKTTRIEINFIKFQNKSLIETKLIDRGELIYRIREPNQYNLITNSELKGNIYYLNTTAKKNFTQLMGIQSVQFGSLFLFKNGFRVFPIGEVGDDSLGLDRRKAQGYNRFLGTREIIGRVDIFGSSQDFQETSSRDQGLIETPAYKQLRDCILNHIIKRLENYVVEVNWADKLDKNYDDITRLNTDPAKNRIINVVSRLAKSKDIELLEYSPNLITIVNEKSESFESSLNSLKLIANQTDNTQLIEQLTKAEKRYNELKEAERLAIIIAEQEKIARKQAELNAAKERSEKERAKLLAEKERREKESALELLKESEQQKQLVEQAYEQEIRKNLFLESENSFSIQNITNMHHQIMILSSTINQYLTNQMDKLIHKEKISDDELKIIFDDLIYKNQQIYSVSKIATKVNYNTDNIVEIQEDLANFISEYIRKICTLYAVNGINISVLELDKKTFLERKFNPIEITMLIDNIISNAQKVHAQNIIFRLSTPVKDQLEIEITDDGDGIDKTIINPEVKIFERGFTTSDGDGSGLGLSHAKHIVEEAGGEINLDLSFLKQNCGTRFIIRFVK